MRRRRGALPALCGVVAWAVAWAGPARAHAFLKQAQPAVGSTVRAAPRQVVIGFSEDLEPLFSTIAVTDAAGRRVDAGDVHQAGDAAHLAVGLGALALGTYAVTWHATSVDTHKTEGHFTFTVSGPQGTVSGPQGTVSGPQGTVSGP